MSEMFHYILKNEMMYYILLVGCVFAVIGGIVAKCKGQSMLLGVFLGLSLSLLGVIIVCVLPKKQSEGWLSKLKKIDLTKAAFVAFIVSFAVLYALYDGFFFGLLGGIAIMVLAVIGLLLLRAFAENKKAIVIIILIMAIVFGGAVYLIRAYAPAEGPKCINCGKNAIYTETGFCRSCYDDVKESVKEGMKNK